MSTAAKPSEQERTPQQTTALLQHDYFWDRAVEFASVNGRREMIAELDELRELFEKVERIASGLCAGVRKQAGLSDVAFEQQVEELRKRAADLDKEAGSEI